MEKDATPKPGLEIHAVGVNVRTETHPIYTVQARISSYPFGILPDGCGGAGY